MYFKYLVEELNGQTTLHLESGFLKRFGYNCCDNELNIESPDDNNIRIIRKWTKSTSKNSLSSTFGIFKFKNLIGYTCEPDGEETYERGKDKRIPVGTYNIEWHQPTQRFPWNKYTKEHPTGKKHHLDYPPVENGFYVFIMIRFLQIEEY